MGRYVTGIDRQGKKSKRLNFFLTSKPSSFRKCHLYFWRRQKHFIVRVVFPQNSSVCSLTLSTNNAIIGINVYLVVAALTLNLCLFLG